MTTKTRWRAGVDTGGTFTDLILLGDDGRMLRRKVLSTPDDFSRGILQALTETLDAHGLSGADLREFIHGTTVATNAILEGKGPTVGLLTTRGFADVLEIGRGRWGTDVHDLLWTKPEPLVSRTHRLEIDERLSAQGEVLCAPSREQVARQLRALHAQGIRDVAVCLLNAYVDPSHEEMVQALARELFPDMAVCRSTEVLGEAREFERTSTTVINTYLRPVVGHYLERLERALEAAGYRGPVLVMQSNGGLVSAEAARRRPVNIVESGPAAGVLAACFLAQQTGERNLIAFDMGGTTAKATLIEDGKPFESMEYHVGGGMSHAGGSGHVIRVPSIEIAEVGSGGGSVAWLDAGGALRVGPRSAGASPGPACYGQGGLEPTTTDAYAALGYLNPGAIAGGARRVDAVRANFAIEQAIAQPAGLSLPEAAHGIYAVATSNILRAIRAVSVERGRDARDYTLIAFGGAGPLHAAELGRMLGLQRVLVPNSPGLFSALGLLIADVQQKFSRTVLRAASDIDTAEAMRLTRIFDELAAQALQELQADGHTSVQISRSATLQYLGQSYELVVPVPDGPLDAPAYARLAQAFCDEHQKTYGYQEDAARVQWVSLRVSACAQSARASYLDLGRQAMGDDAAPSAPMRRAYFGASDGWQDARVVRRSDLRASPVHGPAIVEEFDTTVVVPPRCSATLDDAGNVVLLLEQASARSGQHKPAAGEAAIDAASLELFKNTLESLTDNMARTLARTARSLIVRDSHDFSVALCNAAGELVSGGVGIAVHLESIPNAVASLPPALRQSLQPGDIVITNDPYAGGMHLPDFFAFKPLFVDGQLVGFAAAVAHMVDVGGRVPGGNAADSTEIFQEGIRIPPMRLYARGELDRELLALITANVRQPEVLMADLHAEIAACNTAEAEFALLARRLGTGRLLRQMEALIDYGERMGRQALRALRSGHYAFVDHIDDDGVGGGAPVRIQVAVEVGESGIHVDFEGSSPQVRSAINAPLSITRSAVAYVVKAVIGGEIPNNSGFLRLLHVKAPPGSIVNMAFPAACAARAVTAYRVVDALMGAFAPLRPDRVPAAGDGGPAVISVGGEDEHGKPFVFMELISGAYGGRPGIDGLEGVAMPIVNAQNTSCELIEASYPLRIEHYGFVPGSGGAGQFRGGLSVRRDVRFLGRRAVLQIRSDRAVVQPWGLGGGEPGIRSENTLVTADGQARRLPSKIVTAIEQGALWRHTTASGGGWGDPAARSPDALERDRREGKALTHEERAETLARGL